MNEYVKVGIAKEKKISLFEMNKELQFRDFSTMTIHMQIPIQ